MTFSSDGVKPHKSSPLTMWPITCSINELDTHMKAKFISLCCLYASNSKPPPETILKPFVDQTISLFKEGFVWCDASGRKHKTKVMFCLCVADAPARAMFCNVTQFNGAFGCGHCLHPGSRARQGKGTVQVYDVLYPLPCLREQNSMLMHAEEAVDKGEPVFGVKGPTSLYRIPNFDLARGLVPDIMHGLFLGVNQQFTNLWKKTRTSSCYIQDFGRKIDLVLKTICPPDDLPRIVRPYEKHGSDWKANEEKAFMLLISGVALKGLLPSIYYKHWLLIVNAGLLLHKNEMTTIDIEVAALLIQKFVYEVKSLYHLRNMSYNLHLLTHVADFAHDWGAPWSYSAFMFEDICGTFKRGFHGNRYILQQVFHHFLAKGKVREFAVKYIDPFLENPFTSLNCRLDESYIKDSIQYSNCLRKAKPFGFITGNVTMNERKLLPIQIAVGFPLPKDCFNFISYSRCLFNGKVYGTGSYYCNLKRNNSIIQLQSGEVVRIEQVLQIEKTCAKNHENQEATVCEMSRRQLFPHGNVIIIGKKIKLLSVTPIIDKYANNINLTSFIKKVDTTVRGRDGYGRVQQIMVFFPKDILFKGILIKSANDWYCVINTVKFENS